jgi:hypothetical protein
MKNFKLQRGFILGVTAVAILTVVTGAIIRMQGVNADTQALSTFQTYQTSTSSGTQSLFGLYLGNTQTKVCDAVESMEPSEPTADEIAMLEARDANSDTAVAYIINNTGQADRQFRVVLAANQISKSGNGGVVKFTVMYSPSKLSTSEYPEQVYTEKKGRWMMVFNEDKYLDFYFGNPNLKVGAYQTLTQTASIPDYSWAQRIDLQLRNGSGFYFQGCVRSAINLQDILASSATPTASVSVSASTTASTSATATVSTSAFPSSTVGASTLRSGLRGDYFNGLEFKTGVLTRIDPTINFDWGSTSPNTAITRNNFSARWTGYIKPKYSELYTLKFEHNDGMRVWINDLLVLDKWNPVNVPANQASTTPTVTPTVTSTRTTISTSIVRDTIQLNLTANSLYSIKVEYYDGIKQAVSRMFWQSASQASQIIPKDSLFTAYNPNPAAGTGVGLKGEYFSDNVLTKLFASRTDKTVDFTWKAAAPIKGMPKDGFSVRWTGEVQPRFSDLYTFMVNAKDGVRLKVDNQLVIDQWIKQDKIVQYSGKINLEAGKKYNISLEYYNNTGVARTALLWKSMSQEKQVVPMKQLYSANTTESPTPTPSPGVNQMTVKHGFNAIYLPEGMGLASTDAFTAKGMTMYAFNRNGDKKWTTNVRMLNHWIGYYVFNPLGTQNVDLSIIKVAERPDDKFITKGWNLLSNSSKTDINIADMKYYVSSGCALSAGEVTCQSIGTDTKLGDLLTSKRAYGYIYIIKDPYAAEANDAFELVEVTASNVGSIKIPAGKLFWFYLYN